MDRNPLSPTTVEFLLSLLDRLQISASDPELESIVGTIIAARRELQQAALSPLSPGPRKARSDNDSTSPI